MSMTKKDFIALGDQIKVFDHAENGNRNQFTVKQIHVLADFCQQQNPNFDRERWLNYVAGNCGPSGGKK